MHSQWVSSPSFRSFVYIRLIDVYSQLDHSASSGSVVYSQFVLLYSTSSRSVVSVLSHLRSPLRFHSVLRVIFIEAQKVSFSSACAGFLFPTLSASYFVCWGQSYTVSPSFSCIVFLISGLLVGCSLEVPAPCSYRSSPFCLDASGGTVSASRCVFTADHFSVSLASSSSGSSSSCLDTSGDTGSTSRGSTAVCL